MSDIIIHKASIRIDFRRNRIVITKKAVRAIGDPKYILLLVNPEERTLAIICSDDTERRAHRIRIQKSNEIELYSKGLLKTLLELCDSWQDNCSYKIDGEINQGENAIKFHIDYAVLTGEKE